MVEAGECDLLAAMRAWAMSRVFTLGELEELERRLEATQQMAISLPSGMAARLSSAEDLISQELTGRPFADLSSVSRQIRAQAIFSLTRQMDRDQEMRLMKQIGVLPC